MGARQSNNTRDVCGYCSTVIKSKAWWRKGEDCVQQQKFENSVSFCKLVISSRGTIIITACVKGNNNSKKKEKKKLYVVTN